MLRFPYGLADFPRLIREGYVYVDRTMHIRDAEELGAQLLFIRPRRFGKSLWLSTLASYYDLRTAAQHDDLFGGLAAGRDPTSDAHRYFVLRWDFSNVSPRGTVDDAAGALHDYVNSTLRLFLGDYRELLPEVPIRDDAKYTFLEILGAVRRSGHPLCLLIDEYDNFANEVMVRDQDAYGGLVHGDGPFIYNPTMALYFLDHLQRYGQSPRQLLDANLAADEDKLRFVGEIVAGRQSLLDRLQDEKPLEIPQLVGRLKLSDLVERSGEETFLTSFLTFFGMLTIEGESPGGALRLAPPNLVTRKLYADQVKRILLPAGADRAAAWPPAQAATERGEIAPLISFVEEKIFHAMSNRDYRWMDEHALKMAFMTLLLMTSLTSSSRSRRWAGVTPISACCAASTGAWPRCTTWSSNSSTSPSASSERPPSFAT